MQIPWGSWLEAHPLPALGLMAAGFADGLNPCAATTLLLFIGALLAIVERASHVGKAQRASLHISTVAGASILDISVLYFLLGAGFIKVSSLQLFGNTHVFTRVAGFLAVLLGLVMAAEYVVPEVPLKLSMPAALNCLAHRWGRKPTVGAAFVGGVLIGTCTIPCGEAMYRR